MHQNKSIFFIIRYTQTIVVHPNKSIFFITRYVQNRVCRVQVWCPFLQECGFDGPNVLSTCISSNSLLIPYIDLWNSVNTTSSKYKLYIAWQNSDSIQKKSINLQLYPKLNNEKNMGEFYLIIILSSTHLLSRNQLHLLPKTVDFWCLISSGLAKYIQHIDHCTQHINNKSYKNYVPFFAKK